METTLWMLGLTAATIVALIVGSLYAVRSFYVVPHADEALVKTGGLHPVVSTGGGLWVVPLFHHVTRVSLQAVRIPIVRERADSLPTANKIPAEIRGELIVRVSPDDPSHITLAAQALGSRSELPMDRVIKNQVDSLVTDALRTAAFKKTFLELNAAKKDFADEVTQLIAEDLGKLGLTLTAVTIPHIKQGEFTHDVGDVFAAEGQRNVAETVAKARQETNLITRQAEVTIQEQDVAARKRKLTLDLEQKRLEADQTLQVADYQAQRETEKQQAILAQEQARALTAADQQRAVESARMEQEQRVSELRIEQERALAVAQAGADAERKSAEEDAVRRTQEAEIARQRAVEAATIAKEQAVKVADEARQQAVAEAEIARQVAVANKKEEQAQARARQAVAEAEQRKAEAQIVTVDAQAKADRDKVVVLTKAEEEAGRARIAADRDAYVTTRSAEAERDAAQKRAEATKAEAQGRADAVTVAATGEAEARRIRAAAEADAAAQEAGARTELARATLEEGRACAEAERLLTEARNAVDRHLLVRDVAIEVIRAAPAVVHELMAPVAKVADVKVLQVGGLGGADGGSLPGTILGAGLAMSGALPLLRDGLRALTENADLRELAATVGGAGQELVKGAAAAVAEGVAAPARA